MTHSNIRSVSLGRRARWLRVLGRGPLGPVPRQRSVASLWRARRVPTAHLTSDYGGENALAVRCVGQRREDDHAGVEQRATTPAPWRHRALCHRERCECRCRCRLTSPATEGGGRARRGVPAGALKVSRVCRRGKRDLGRKAAQLADGVRRQHVWVEPNDAAERSARACGEARRAVRRRRDRARALSHSSRLVRRGRRRVACGVWRVACGVWRVAGGGTHARRISSLSSTSVLPQKKFSRGYAGYRYGKRGQTSTSTPAAVVSAAR